MQNRQSDEDIARKAVALQGLCAVLMNNTPPAAVFDAMVTALEDVPAKELENAMPSILRTYHRMPSIAELREAVLSGAFRPVRVVQAEATETFDAMFRRLDRDDLAMTEEEYEQHIAEGGYVPGGDE